MKSIQTHILAVCLTLLLVSSTAFAKPLMLAANYWEPFTGQELTEQGFASHLVSKVLESKGHDVEIVIMPWARILHLLKSENPTIDGVVSIWYTREREDYVLFSNAYYHNELCLVKHESNPFKFNAISDLTGKLIGVGRNYEYSDELTNATHFERAEAVTLTQNLLRLDRSRIDLVLTDCVIGNYHLTRLRGRGELQGNLTLMSKVIDTRPLYFGVSPRLQEAQQIIEDFNSGFVQLSQSGNLQQIYDFWNISPMNKL